MLQKWQSRSQTIINPGSAPIVQPVVVPVNSGNIQLKIYHNNLLFNLLHSRWQIKLILTAVLVLPLICFGYIKYHSHSTKPAVEISKSAASKSSNQNYELSNDQLPAGSTSGDTHSSKNASSAGSKTTQSSTKTSTTSNGAGSATGGSSSVGSTGSGGTGATGLTGPYGTPLTTDGLGNLEIGKANGRLVSYRFRATHTGPISTIGNFFVYRAGYFAGTGGSVHVSLQTDDGSASHLPSGIVLASHTITDPMASNFRTFSLDSLASLVSGQLYHLVYTNSDSSPTANYVSIDDMFQNSPGTQMQPTVSDTDLAVVWKYDSFNPWEVNRNHTPVYVIHYSDGATQGQGYIDALSSSGLQSIGGVNQVQEIFTVSGSSRTISKVQARLSKTGSSALVVQLKQGSSVLASATIPASAISSSYSWVTANLGSSFNLNSGTTYSVVLTSATASYNIFPAQEGTNYGLTGGNNFTDGHYSYSTNSGSTFQNLNSRTDYDLQLYLE